MSWDDVYARGEQLNRYPFDAVVSFVYRNAPRDRPPSEVAVLEVGCGAGNNIWFLAREGFRAAGIDSSPTALRYARQRLAADGLSADLHVAEFASLPFKDGVFDLVIDRAALTCRPPAKAARALAELWRVSRPGARLMFTPYSPGGAPAVPGADVFSYTREDVDAALGKLWRPLAVGHTEQRSEDGVVSYWNVVAARAA